MKDYAFLLNRPEHQFDDAAINHELSNQRVLVTGAGGSIGSAIVHRLVEARTPFIGAVGHSELPIFNLLRDTKHSYAPIQHAIANAGNKAAMRAIIDKWEPTLIIHAAAHKHVGLMQDQPSAAFINNTAATFDLAQVALESRSVRKFVFISTDKAVAPTSTMGASKRLAEVLLRTHFSPFATVCRFGNVLGSSGSLVEIVERQIEKGEQIVINDPRMTRFFITAREAVGLVMTAALLEEGNCFTIDMGKPIPITDIVEKLRAPTYYSNIRCGVPGSGEKLDEEIVGPGEASEPSGNPAILRILTKPNPKIEEIINRIAINPYAIIKEAHTA